MPDGTDSNLVKAVVVAGGEEIPVRFNPTEYNLDKSISYADQSLPGFTSPVTQFTSGEAETLSMELFFDAYEEDERDVRTYTDRVRGLLEVDGDLHAPPICRFVWGGLDFKSVLQSANTRFTMFLPTGVPVRARMDVTFKEYRPPGEQAEQVRRSSADKTKLRRVTEEETLWLLADAEYGDPTRWRPIAEANDIDNPRRLRPGDRLVVPRVEP
ncbi:LysM domain-containing protein [Halogeometricum rufum]|jgi:nucleoid-associated protein YgaU|uniref:LysM domain-containing protein n=1 Tax=Halogeometricum rufum TaxID=553469 RepID=A0A1I6IQJ8_9EURY|nr:MULTISPECIES: LysM peptidoglycan-binding domain-containing protein [Halogeometricum]MUV56004.1 LysM peptidoglycan-binding domain-containing protein [Halogeometricum sp. CBA1124]SFR68988.1 LysM domain-containing protein [Halogeometricum rufum]